MKEGEKVYVITEYQIEEDPEENFYQPRCLVGFKSNVLTLLSSSMCNILCKSEDVA